ncbi:MAG: hypothetical protein A2Y94_10560 [Caldithrix sp. RBG_13_44_9]|nr:MAG: hypothetical protein A2Y94_10560 [Caldithrix sp. RBG_13_44_9]
MGPYQPFAKLLIIAGIVLLAIGLILLAVPKIPFIGKLPGDILIQKKNFTFYFPVVSLLILNLIIFIFLYWLKK